MNLEKKLADWQKQKFLTAKAAEKILSYERHKKANEFSYIMLGLGSFFIGVGLIALIAANWENISAGIKLGSAGLLLVLCACGIYICHLKGKTLLQEILLLLYALLILATIGLVAQIFQLQPEGLKAFVFWSLLCIPLLPLSSAQPLSWVWIPTFLISVCEQLGRQTWYQSWQNYISDNFAAGEGLFVLFLLTLIYAAIPQRLKGQAWYKSLQTWLIIGISMIAIYLDAFQGYYDAAAEEAGLSSAGIFALMLIALAAINHWQKQSQQTALLMAVLLLFSFLLQQNERYSLINELLSFIMTLSLLAVVLFYAYRLAKPRLINLAAGLIALRVLLGYFELFGTLSLTGWGFILSGFAIFISWGIWKKIAFLSPIDKEEKTNA